MPHPIPTDAFGHPINTGDTVVLSAASHTGSPGLVHAEVTRFTPSGNLVDLVVTRVGRETGSARNRVGDAVRRQVGRVQVIHSAAQAAEVDQVLTEAAAAGLLREAVAQ